MFLLEFLANLLDTEQQGVEVKETEINIFADVIEKELGISCSSLSGANIANEGQSANSSVSDLFSL
jgi:glycerol-3-phosphate dehydrogenase